VGNAKRDILSGTRLLFYLQTRAMRMQSLLHNFLTVFRPPKAFQLCAMGAHAGHNEQRHNRNNRTCPRILALKSWRDDELYQSFDSIQRRNLSRLDKLLPSQPHLMGSSPASAESSTTRLLPGQSPPLAVLTDTNKSGIVVIAASLCLVFSVFSMAIRVFVRHYFRRTRLGLDDVASIAAMVCWPWFTVIKFSRLTNSGGEGYYDSTIRLCLRPGQKRIREYYTGSIVCRCDGVAAGMTLS